MGSTIHYRFSAGRRSTEQPRALVAKLRERALDLPFERVENVIELKGAKCDYQECPPEHPYRRLLIQAREHVENPPERGCSYVLAPCHVLAFSTWPGKDCEEANFGLCRFPETLEIEDPRQPGRRRKIPSRLNGWPWGSFCKTQYASNSTCGGVANFLRCHSSVIRLLDCAQELGILETVSDEGGFWEKRDLAALASAVGQWNAMVAGLTGQFKDLYGPDLVAAITGFPDFEHLEAKDRNS
jgi:hypothetical protein